MTFTTNGSAVVFTTSGTATSFTVTPAVSGFTTSPTVTPGAHASTHGAGGADPITTLGAVAHSGQQTFAAGSAAGPSIAPTGDTNTGLYFPAADQVGIATAGTAAVVVNATQQLGIATNPSSRFHIGGSGAALILHDSTGAIPEHRFRRYGGTFGAPVIVSSGDGIGVIAAHAYDGTTTRIAASIGFNVDGTPGASDMPGRIGFYTTADGAASETERMRIDNAGLITGTGTSLGAWTSYTPVLSGTGWALGDGTIAGKYMRIGKMVFFWAYFLSGSTSTFGSGNPVLTLPLTSNADAVEGRYNVAFFDTSTSTRYFARAVPTTTTVIMVTVGTNGVQVTTNSTTPFTWAVGDAITASGWYEVS